MSFIILLFIIIVASYASSHMVLYGVTYWWKLADAERDAAGNIRDTPDNQTLRKRAIALVNGGLVVWGLAVIFITNIGTATTIVSVLQAVGIDLSALGTL